MSTLVGVIREMALQAAKDRPAYVRGEIKHVAQSGLVGVATGGKFVAATPTISDPIQEGSVVTLAKDANGMYHMVGGYRG